MSSHSSTNGAPDELWDYYGGSVLIAIFASWWDERTLYGILPLIFRGTLYIVALLDRAMVFPHKSQYKFTRMRFGVPLNSRPFGGQMCDTLQGICLFASNIHGLMTMLITVLWGQRRTGLRGAFFGLHVRRALLSNRTRGTYVTTIDLTTREHTLYTTTPFFWLRCGARCLTVRCALQCLVVSWRLYGIYR